MGERCHDVVELLSAHVDRELDAPAEDRVVAHLASCAACRQEVAALRRVKELLRSGPQHRLPASVAAALADDVTEVAPSSSRAPALAGAGALAAIALLAVTAFTLGGSTAERTVEVPLDLFVADHLVQTVSGPVVTPALAPGTP